MEKKMSLPKELYQNRKLIWSLAKNDFKTKYAGSYLGIVWAFIQPVVTVLVYWFVFGVVRQGSPKAVPFVLWLIAGLVPWFFFQEALTQSTNALIEYSYLVKKVVFKIDILPMVKIIASLFVHLFFVAFTVFLFCCYGYFPDLYDLQLVYYSFCVFMLVLAMIPKHTLQSQARPSMRMVMSLLKGMAQAFSLMAVAPLSMSMAV